MAENKSEFLGDEARWLAEWETDSSLREEFSDNKDRWLAFCRADANGQIKLFKR
jgi:hypothetical protein